MNEVIGNFYKENKLPEVLLKQKLNKFERNKDIADEFENWILSKKFKDEDAVTVEGYTAKSLSELSKYLDGDGAFMLLIELREEPEKAKKRIDRGFKMK